MRAEVSAHGKHIVIEGRASEFAEFIGLLIDREQAGEGSETSKAVAVRQVHQLGTAGGAALGCQDWQSSLGGQPARQYTLLGTSF